MEQQKYSEAFSDCMHSQLIGLSAALPITATQLRAWASSEGYVDDSDTPYNLLARKINEFIAEARNG